MGGLESSSWILSSAAHFSLLTGPPTDRLRGAAWSFGRGACTEENSSGYWRAWEWPRLGQLLSFPSNRQRICGFEFLPPEMKHFYLPFFWDLRNSGTKKHAT